MRATTGDGHTLQLPDSNLPALAPALRRAGLGGVLSANYDGNPSAAVARTVKDLAASARRAGVVRHVPTGRRFPVFASALAGRSVHLVTRPLGPARSALVAVRPGGPSSAETETGPGAADVHAGIFRNLQRRGLADAGKRGNRNLPESRKVRWGMAQTNASGQKTPAPSGRKSNKPDLAYVDARGRRVNVEIDTTRRGMQGHMQRNVASDPNAVHVFLLVDRDGRVLERQTVTPGRGGNQIRRTRNFGPRGTTVGQITRQLPAPAGARPQRPRPKRRAGQRESESEFEFEFFNV